MRRRQVIAAVGLLTIAGIIIYFSRRRTKKLINEYKAEQVSEHGYETAHDVLFPKRKKLIRKQK